MSRVDALRQTEDKPSIGLTMQVLTTNWTPTPPSNFAIVVANSGEMLTIAAPESSFRDPSYLVMLVEDPSDDLSDEILFRVHSRDLQSARQTALGFVSGTPWSVHDVWPEDGICEQ